MPTTISNETFEEMVFRAALTMRPQSRVAANGVHITWQATLQERMDWVRPLIASACAVPTQTNEAES